MVCLKMEGGTEWKGPLQLAFRNGPNGIEFASANRKRFTTVAIGQKMPRHHHQPRWPFHRDSATHTPVGSGLGRIIEKNIQLIEAHRAESEQQKSFQSHLADFITTWSGSMPFIFAHFVWFGVWIAVNLGWFGFTPFDPFPFGLLTTIVSLEAIFLSTFVLVSQNRQAALADRRADLDLQVNLLAEFEMTRVLTLVDRLAKKFDIPDYDDGELAELERDVEPERLLKELEDHEDKRNSKS
jgi:uncharacterized membrane protein